MSPFFNLHSHFKKNNAIINIDNSSQFPLNENFYYSIGSHPWYNQFTVKQIENHLKNNRCIVAIGECGIDKIRYLLSVDEQIELLQQQIELSEKYKLPLILHIVKSFNEIIKLKKDLKPQQPWIIHGFNSYKHAQPLIDAEFYLSFGTALLSNIKLQNVFKNLPSNRIFFETDDTQIDIEKIYTFASGLKQVELNKLIRQINENLIKVFDGKLVRTP